ncbi:MAG: thioredoxin domain-containing protein [Firmicutes bacterium]|nr:thioredoxin domain-containing protein [Bacillota bacterium]
MPETKVANRLIHEASPYLLQHAYNPVDWYPWGDEAFQKAKAEDKPILLSCGYSACHWCHVMERESFEDPEIAGLMNQYFVNIKVDREERPDLDQIYQQAVQMITGHGGWPLTAFLDHNKRPFYGGTYYPPVSMYGRPGLPDILEAIHRKWIKERDQIHEAGEKLTEYLQTEAGKTHQAGIPEDLPEKAVSELYRYADTNNGGFNNAPKFPNPNLLQLLINVGSRRGASRELEHCLFTLDRMARGGIYDQLGGGFHRYSTDSIWLIPHFEKMLYDNAQLLKLYSVGYQLTGDQEYRRIVKETTEYTRREMTAPEGGFYATQDADSEGDEGKYFLWTPQQIQEALDEDQARLIIEYYGISQEGNFEGKNILNRLPESDDWKINAEDLAKLKTAREKLLRIREERVKPFRDEKVITSWNGLMISGLAISFQVFEDRADYETARRGANFILKSSRLTNGDLARVYKDGKAYGEAFLDDYAFLARGLLDLYEADFDSNWLTRSMELTEEAIDRFRNRNGLYYLTSENGSELISRPFSGVDQAIPSGVAIHTENLLKLAAYTGKKEFREEAGGIFKAYSKEMSHNSWGYAALISALDMYLQGIKEFVFVSDESNPPEILVGLRRKFLPYRIIGWKGAGEELKKHPAGVLFEGREPVNGEPTCYVCINQSCLPPLTKGEELEKVCFYPRVLSD